MDDFEVDGDKRYTSGDDPNKDVLQSAHDDIKPQFQLGNDSDAKPDASNPNRILGNAEQNASTSINNNTDSDDTKSDANTAESMGGNGFANNVTGDTSTRTKFSSGGAKGFLKKRAPLLALIALLGGGGIGIMSTQNLLPFSLATRAMQEWNSQEVMSSRRYRYLLNKKLRAVDTNGSKHTNMFGDLKISKKQKKFLKKQGIEVIEIESGGKKANALLADDGTGKKKLILGNGKGSGINKAFRNSVAADMASGKLKGAKGADFGSNTKPITLKTALKTDDSFFVKFNYGSKAVSSHVSGWFDNVFEGVRKRLKLTRNRWFGFLRSDDESTRVKNYKERGKLDENRLNIENKVVGQEESEDDSGKKQVIDGEESESETRVKANETETINKIKNKVEVAGKAAGGASILCTFYAMMGSINAIKYAAEMAQILNYTSGFYEAVDKTKAGEGDASAMAEYLNDLSKPDKNGLTGLSATGIGALISGTHVNTAAAYDKSASETAKAQAESALKFNFDDSTTLSAALNDPGLMKDFFGGVKYTVGAMQKCIYGRIFAAGVSLASDIALTVTTFGIGTVVKKLAVGAAKTLAIQAGITFLASIFIPKIAQLLVQNFVDGVVGPDLGNALASGSNMYLGKNHQAGGGSPGTQAEVMAFKREQAAVLAENARVDRAVLSPFDTSTNNTFLGKLAYSVMPLTTTMGSISVTTNKLANLVSSSFANLLPSASAIGETSLNQEQGICPTQNAIDVVADGFCNPYYISDTTTFGSYDQDDPFDPEALFALVDDANPNNFQKNSSGEIEVNEDGNPIINNSLEESELFQYINYCSNRDSMLGTADQNIANSFRLIKNQTVSTILDAVPFVGDIKDIAEAAEDANNADWISGRKCVADNSGSTNSDWTSKMRLYQRYLEDQRLYENMGVIEKSTVQIALDDYYEEHPLDTSDTGIIARYSGLTKNQVEDTLAFVDYFNYIAEYDPSELYPEYNPNPITNMLSSVVVKNSFSSPVSTLYEAPIFVDLRNRTFSI